MTLILLLLAFLLPAAESIAASTIRDLVYSDGVSIGAPTLDLYLPDESARRAPLVVYVAGRFWEEGDGGRAAERSLARPLQARGAAVAIVRHRPAPEHRHPTFARNVAEAVAYLLQRAEQYRFDRQRVFLAGHGSGGQVAALLALDADLLDRWGITHRDLAGVIVLSGLLDLDPARDLSKEQLAFYQRAYGSARKRRQASPLHLARARAPLFLVIAAGHDIPGLQAAALAFAEALRGKGHPNAEAFIATHSDHRSIVDLTNPRNSARDLILSLLGLAPEVVDVRDVFAARRYWRDPAFSTVGFWTQRSRSGESLVTGHEGDPEVQRALHGFFSQSRKKRPPIRVDRYDSVDLFAWLEALGPEKVGSGRFLVLTDARGERAVFPADALRELEPRIVVGIDGERNLFRVTSVYHTRREYTWVEEAPRKRAMARPLGAFLLLRGEPTAVLGHPVFGRYGLTPDSFRLTDDDPLLPIRQDLHPRVQALFTHENGCLSCHAFRGAGARAGHLLARDGSLVGGFALALEEYPPAVWRRYVHEQVAVADEIGATPVPLDPEAARLLFEAVVRERGR